MRAKANIRANVYVIGGDGGTVKIGMSSKPKVRVRALERSEGRQLAVLHLVHRPLGDAEMVEDLAHALLDAKRTDGEWFDVTPEEAIAAVTEAIALVEANPNIKPQPVAEVKVQITLTLYPDLLVRLNELAGRMHMGRAGMINMALAHFVERVSKPGATP